MNFGNVKESLQDESKSPSDVEVTVYSISDMMKHAIPNPEDKSACEMLQDKYNSGWLTHKTKQFLPQAVFDDAKNWSP